MVKMIINAQLIQLYNLKPTQFNIENNLCAVDCFGFKFWKIQKKFKKIWVILTVNSTNRSNVVMNSHQR